MAEHGGRFKDLTGKTFGELTVLLLHHIRKGHACWECECSCGRRKIITTGQLNLGTRSCGHLIGNATHGHSRGQTRPGPGCSPTYSSWKAMIGRCFHRSNPGYNHSKKRNITVCRRWLKFENFLADMGERPSLKHTIDRYPNNNGNYEPTNCRWATRRQQANNRIDNNVFTYKGERLTLTEIAERSGISYERLRHRVVRAGWTLDKALTTPKVQGQRGRG